MLEAPALDADERAVREQIRDLGEQLRFQLGSPNRWTGALRRMTFARNVQGSNSIEGINAKVDDVAAIAAGEKPASVDEETERALAGYQLAMTYVLQLAKAPPVNIDISLVNALHFMVASYDLTKWPGRFRPGPIYVQQEQTGDIVHEGAAAADLDPLMTELVEAASEPGDNLIRAAMAHLNFVLIHPYRDGNGRMARVLQGLVLAADGDVSPVFMSIEEYLGAHTQAYYDVLAEVGGGSWPPPNTHPDAVRPWIRFILTAHLNQALERVERMRASGDAYDALATLVAAAGLPERTLEAVYDAIFGATVTRSRYLAALADSGEEISDQTATRDLSSLARAGLLAQSGQKRGSRYTAGERVLEVRREVGLGKAWRPVDPFAS